MQKTIRIFLLVLIIVGVVLLITQKVWVPKLVNYILAMETPDTQTITLEPAAPGNLTMTQTYSSEAMNFSIKYPAGYTVDASYQYQALGPGKEINGVKFTIPATLYAGTNLSRDSYISVETIPGGYVCSAALFLDKQIAKIKTVTDNGTEYSFGTSNDAGAGNRYDETVYVFPNTNPCLAVRYFIHYGAFENYPAGSINHFDEQALTAQFDSIRRTLQLGLK